MHLVTRRNWAVFSKALSWRFTKLRRGLASRLLSLSAGGSADSRSFPGLAFARLRSAPLCVVLAGLTFCQFAPRSGASFFAGSRGSGSPVTPALPGPFLSFPYRPDFGGGLSCPIRQPARLCSRVGLSPYRAGAAFCCAFLPFSCCLLVARDGYARAKGL